MSMKLESPPGAVAPATALETPSAALSSTPVPAPSEPTGERAEPLSRRRIAAGEEIQRRQLWAQNRFWMETQNLATKRYGGRRKQHYQAFELAMKGFRWGLELTRQLERGKRNAEDIRLTEYEIGFEGLPRAFDGYRILHVSDPHFDGMPGLEQRAIELVKDRQFDLCVFTGDYRNAVHGPIREALAALARLVDSIRSRDGFLGVLGNHDDCHMVERLERLGVRMLLNEGVNIERNGASIQVLGTDDVHYYYTDQALHTLDLAERAFTVVLVHSAELCEEAAAAGASLYLCGHTHAGQVCLPGGIPLVRHLRAGRAYYKGRWKHAGMHGITSAGLGTSGVPVRFNTRGELVVVTLKAR